MGLALSLFFFIALGALVFWEFDMWIILIPAPKAGENWIHREADDNPFDMTGVVIYHVLAIKRGWVQYSYIDTKMSAVTTSCRISKFKLSKKRLKEDKNA